MVVLLSPSPAVAHVSQDGGECAARTQEIMKYYFGSSSNSFCSKFSLMPKRFLSCASQRVVLSCFRILYGVTLLQVKIYKTFNWKAKAFVSDSQKEAHVRMCQSQAVL